MSELKKYSIPFEGLKAGDHDYEYLIDKSFFDEFENSEIEDGEVQVRLVLTKRENMLLLRFDIGGELFIHCDRCWDIMAYPVQNHENLVVKLGEEEKESDDEIIFLADSEFEINVAQYIYEFINLALPQKRVHEEGNCNEEVIAKLEEINEKAESKKQVDPRWEKLEQLKQDQS